MFNHPEQVTAYSEDEGESLGDDPYTLTTPWPDILQILSGLM